MTDPSLFKEILSLGQLSSVDLLQVFLKTFSKKPMLNQSLDILLVLIENTDVNKDEVTEIFTHITKLLWPLITDRDENTSDEHVCKIVEIVKLCYTSCNKTEKKQIEKWCLYQLQAYLLDSMENRKHMDHVINILATVIKMHHSKEWLETLLQIVLLVLKEADQHLSGQLACLILPSLLCSAACQHMTAEILETVWERIFSISDQNSKKNYKCAMMTAQSEQPYLLLSGLADYYFPLSGKSVLSPQLTSRHEFWKMLQRGFFQSSTLTRKRSMYLLKRILDTTETCGEALNMINLDPHSKGILNMDHLEQIVPIFWWNAENKQKLSVTWTNFILLMETLEEKQVHVIKPLMPSLQSLVEATYSTGLGFPLFHTSWLLTVIQRISTHESSYIRRWGIHQLLAVDLTKCPILQQGGDEFICGPLITILSETIVYSRSPDIELGMCPTGGILLKQFFQSCLDALPEEQKGTSNLFETFMEELQLISWGGMALTFVTEALAELSISPVWSPSVLRYIDILLTTSVRNMENIYRDAVCCFLVKSLTKLLDPNKLNVEILGSAVNLFAGEECLQTDTTTWRRLVKWFQNLQTKPNCTKEDWIPYLNGHISKYITGSEESGLGSDVDWLVSVMLLLTDAGLVVVPAYSSQHPLSCLLQPSVDILNQVNTHAYMPHIRADRALALLATTLKFISTRNKAKVSVQNSLACCVQDVLIYIQRRATQSMPQEKCVSSIHVYVEFVSVILQHGLDSTLVTQPLISLCKACIQILQNRNEKADETTRELNRYCAMLLLSAVVESLSSLQCDIGRILLDFFRVLEPVTHYTKPSDFTDDSNLLGNGSSAGGMTWGKMSCEFLATHWNCLHSLIQYDGSSLQQSYSEYMDPALMTLDVVSGLAVRPVLRCIGTLLPKCPEENVVPVILACWSKVKEDNKYIHFWPAYEAFIQLTFQSFTLQQDVDSPITECLKQMLQTILNMGDEKGGVMNRVTDQLSAWSQMSENNMTHFTKYSEFVIDALTFGPFHVKGKRYMHEVQSYLATLGDDLTNRHLGWANDTDNMVRARMLTLLANLHYNIPEHVIFGKTILQGLMSRYKQLSQMQTYRNFSNSLSHRKKHRILTSMIILESLVSEDILDEVVFFLMEILIYEVQPSVRAIAEWMVIRITHRFPSLLQKLWKQLQDISEKRAANICSLLTIVTHLAKLLQSSNKELETFVLDAIPQVLSLCTVHHYNCRTYAQACIITIWNVCQEQQLHTVMQKHSLIKSIVDFHQQNHSHACKSTYLLLENFWFLLHADKDFSMQTLFYTLPKLFMISDEEWIHPKVFQQTMLMEEHNIPISNSRQVLDCCQPGNWKVKVTGHDSDTGEYCNVQKKIIPWRMMIPQEELEQQLVEEYEERRPRTSGLIVVTTLIEKIPNLGGLCRTCEIFGVSEFVVRNLKYVEEKNFQTLAVTAHKWIPIKEVRVESLQRYMLTMKAKGYTLVGAEQTSNSQQLTKYSFPKKTLLILGNEKEGIPVELIQLLDVCVEIPQTGIIRSLNVHVSGALVIWEYAKQHMFS